MKPGRKPTDRALKLARGTYRAERDAGAALGVTGTLPIQPENLTAPGHAVWLDNIGRVAANRKAMEADSLLFSVFCNLGGAINAAWDAGEVPPIGAIAELRRLAELFGLAGSGSRLQSAPPEGANPFANNGRC